MTSFWKGRQRPNFGLPRWASRLDGPRFDALERAMREALARNDRKGEVSRGALHVEGPLGKEVLALDALIEHLRQVPAEGAYDAVLAWFQRRWEADDADLLRQVRAQLPLALTRLRLRLMVVDDEPGQGPPAVARLLAPGLLEAVCLDLDNTTAAVRLEDLATWQLTHEAALSVAQENTRERWPAEPAKWEVVPQPNNARLHRLRPDSEPLVACLREVVGALAGPQGSVVVAVPRRSEAWAAHLLDQTALVHLGALARQTAVSFRSGPASLSSDLYWVRRERWVRLPCYLDEDRMTFRPTAEFMSLLENLPPLPEA